MPRLAIRPLVFRTIILLVVVNAAAGIAVIVAGGDSQIGDTESNILLTTGMLSLAALLLLPCVLAHEAGRPKPFTLLPSFAVSCLLIGFSLGIYLLWTDPSGNTPENIAWSFGIGGGGASFVCLISLVRMRRGFVWLQLLAIVFSTVLIGPRRKATQWLRAPPGRTRGRAAARVPSMALTTAWNSPRRCRIWQR
jgi:hypothetical protein